MCVFFFSWIYIRPIANQIGENLSVSSVTPTFRKILHNETWYDFSLKMANFYGGFWVYSLNSLISFMCNFLIPMAELSELLSSCSLVRFGLQQAIRVLSAESWKKSTFFPIPQFSHICWEAKLTTSPETQTDKQRNGHYQMYYLPATQSIRIQMWWVFSHSLSCTSYIHLVWP